MTQLDITREDGASRGRYVARLDGIDAEAELTYSRASPTLIIADHTGVPDAFRGKGVGPRAGDAHDRGCARRGVQDLRALPLREGGAAKHPEWADVFQD